LIKMINKKIQIEETIGTGLPTLLAINLKLADGDLPEKGKRHDSDVSALQKIRNNLGSGKITVIAKQNRSFEIKTEGGVILLTE
jgi:hypothetical protein